MAAGQDPVPTINLGPAGPLTARERRNLIKTQNLADVSRDSLEAQAIDFTTADLNVTDDAVIDDDASVGGDLTVTGASTVTGDASFEDDVTLDSTLTVAGIRQTPTVTEYTTIVTIDSTKIVGTASGDIGHADGAILVASPTAGYTLEFVSAFLIYDHSTADFAGGSNDLVVQVGVNGAQVTMSSAITDATFLTASADVMIRVGAIATEVVYSDNGAISLHSTAYTNNGGTVAGAIRVHLTYCKHTTGL